MADGDCLLDIADFGAFEGYSVKGYFHRFSANIAQEALRFKEKFSAIFGGGSGKKMRTFGIDIKTLTGYF